MEHIMSEEEKLLRQCRKPTGDLGFEVGKRMNVSHRELREWGFEVLKETKVTNVLDIGCGGGHASERLLELYPEAEIHGIDYSPEMVKLAREVNKIAVEQGRITVQQGEVSSLPFQNDTFDLAIAVETCYFWPNLTEDMKEVLRVLVDGGKLLIINEIYEDERFAERNRKYAELAGVEYFTPAEFKKIILDAGFRECEITLKPENNWLTALAVK
jgi:SAM-dependent methyltransferase